MNKIIGRNEVIRIPEMKLIGGGKPIIHVDENASMSEERTTFKEAMAKLEHIQRFKKLYAHMNEKIALATGAFEANLFEKPVTMMKWGEKYSGYYIKWLPIDFIIYPFNMRYHRSWNWLMKAVDFIENTTSYSVYISNSHCAIYQSGELMWSSKSEESTLDATFKCVYLWALNTLDRKESNE